MVDSHVVSALKAKRAELAGLIDANQDQLRQHIIDLDNVDATLRIFIPDIDLEEIRPRPLPPRFQAYKGEVMRITLNALRHNPSPMNTHELTHHVLTERGLLTTNKRMLRTIAKRVAACMKNMRNRGLVSSVRGPSNRIVWRLAAVPVEGKKLGEFRAKTGIGARPAHE